ncbi:MAG: NAD(P)/FAD-dependent oxidoreductase [Alphaproteobacteria bacterium]|nr:NAD(P)/FAD-dependent oxidoreductase [Alphaproteobacteria bacterium]
MPEALDAIVIGAGLGGLAAACRLAQEGLRVQVVERKDHPGGTAYGYAREGFTFPMGPLGVSSPDRIRASLEALGVTLPEPWRRVHYRVRAFGLDLPISRPLEELVEAYAAVNPVDGPAVRRFFEDARAAWRGAVLEDGAHAAAQHLSMRVRDQRLRRVLGSLGTRAPYSSLSLLRSMWGLMVEEGIWHPPGGTRGLAERLVARFEALAAEGSALRLSAPVRQVLVERGQVAGVQLEGGEVLRSARVICNTDYRVAVSSLIPADALPAGWRAAVLGAKVTDSNVQVSLGVRAADVDLSAFSRASRLITRREAREPAARGHGARRYADDELEISLLTEEDPSMAPPGGAVIVIRTEGELEDFQPFRPSFGARTEAYAAFKQALAAELIDAAAEHLPGLRDAIEVLDVATPLTFREAGGRTGGNVAGWSWDWEDRPEGAALDLIGTPVRGLYMAGVQALSALFIGGVPTALRSGALAAERALAGVGPVDSTPLAP